MVHLIFCRAIVLPGNLRAMATTSRCTGILARFIRRWESLMLSPSTLTSANQPRCSRPAVTVAFTLQKECVACMLVTREIISLCVPSSGVFSEYSWFWSSIAVQPSDHSALHRLAIRITGHMVTYSVSCSCSCNHGLTQTEVACITILAIGRLLAKAIIEEQTIAPQFSRYNAPFSTLALGAHCHASFLFGLFHRRHTATTLDRF